MTDHYDAIVIGAGSAGSVVTRRLDRRRAARAAARSRRPRHQPHDPRHGRHGLALARPRGLGLLHRPAGTRRRPTGCTFRAERCSAGRTRSTPRSGCEATPRTTTAGRPTAARAGRGTTCCPSSRRSRTTTADPARPAVSAGPSTWSATTRSSRSSSRSSTPRSRSDIPHNPDYNDGVLDGVSQEQITVRDGSRLNTYIAYVRPIEDHPNLDDRDGGVGAPRAAERRPRHRRRGRDRRRGPHGAPPTTSCSPPARWTRRGSCCVRASARRTSSRELGIEPLVDLPGVGKNLHDHLLSPVIFTTDERDGRPSAARESR